MGDIPTRLAGRDGSVLVVRLPFEVNHDSAEPIRQCVARALPNRDGAGCVLDLADVVLITSIGIASLLQVQEFCRDRGAPLILAAVPPRQMNFLRMLKLDRKFEFSPSVDEAVARLDGV